MSGINKGSAGVTYELTPLTARPLTGTTVPPETADVIHYPISGAVNDSPKSSEVLLASPEFLYDGADRVDGVSWANSGTVVGSNLTYVDEPLQEDHIHFPGTSGNTLQVPDEAALDFVASAEMEIVVRMAADWHHETRRQAIVAKRGGASQSYELVILGGGTGAVNAGMLMFKTAASVSDAAAVCRYPVPFMPYETGWIKVTWNNTNNKVRYYVASDKATEPTGAEWMEIGSITGAYQTSNAALVANTDPVFIGGITAVGATAALAGRVYYVAIRGAIGGANVLTIDVPVDCAATVPDTDVSFVATSGQTVTINKSGTPPATCRLHNTLDVTLTYPWYEVSLPPELEVGLGDAVLIWVQMVGTTASTPDTRLPLVSILGARENYYPGHGIWYSLDTNKVGTFMSNESGVITGAVSSTSWSTAIGTGIQGVFMWLNRMGTTNELFHGATLGVHNGATDFGGINAYYGTMAIGDSEPDGTYFKLRIIAPEIAPIDILQVGFKVVDASAPPLPIFSTLATDWDNTIRDHGRALGGVFPTWDIGESMYVNTAGTPDWVGQPLSAGSWLVAETSGLETAVTWGNHAESAGNVWVVPHDNQASLGAILTLDENESTLFWAVVSGRNDGVYRDILEAYDPVTDSFIDMGAQFLDSNDQPYLYFDIYTPLGYQWGQVEADPDWTVPGTWSDPIIIAMWLERRPSETTDRLWGYATGLGEWRQMTQEVAPYKPGNIVIADGLKFLDEIGGIAVWGFGLDMDCGSPSVESIDQILTDVILRNG